MRILRSLVLMSLISLSACSGWQSVMDAQGHAERLASLIWLFSALLGLIWLAVVLALLFAFWRKRQPSDPRDAFASGGAAEQGSLRIVFCLVLATGAIVIALTGVSYIGQSRLFTAKPNDIVISVTGHQWWWEFRYEDDFAPSDIFTTANEIHIPVGVPVKIQLQSGDVIHSFWVPSLNGKMDLIPGQPNETELLATRPGVYRGQCAEFCGLQHAHMSLLVIAEDKPSFDRWRAAQLASGTEPMTQEQEEGRAVFLSHACTMCHAIRGTSAGGRAGPDLTHVGSRRTIAAGELLFNRGTLAAWIADPQNIKPGSQMPAVALEPHELNVVSAYLESLK